jgi:hypothetical protein
MLRKNTDSVRFRMHCRGKLGPVREDQENEGRNYKIKSFMVFSITLRARKSMGMRWEENAARM